MSFFKKYLHRKNNNSTDSTRSTCNLVSQPSSTISYFEDPITSQTFGPISDSNQIPLKNPVLGHLKPGHHYYGSNEKLPNQVALSRDSPTSIGADTKRSLEDTNLDILDANLRKLSGESLCSSVAMISSQGSRASQGSKMDMELRRLDAKDRRLITQLLDTNRGWQDLAASILHPDRSDEKLFTDNNIKVLCGKVDSPSDEILKTWSTTGRNRPRAQDFYELLVQIGQLNIADQLIGALGLHNGDASGPLFPAGNGTSTNCYLDAAINFSSAINIDASNIKPFLPGVCQICYDSVAEATSNFSAESTNKIGEGGFGSVFKVIIDGEEMAVKVLKENPELFFNEIEKMSQLKHPNLLQLVGICEHDKTPCIVTKYMRNGNLQQCLQGKNMLWPLRHRILNEIACALEYLHSLDPPIVHRDIKTANILLDEDMNAFLGDFGLARSKKNTQTSFTQQIAGTACYMPHEASCGEINVKTDVYSFGIVIFEVLTGLEVFDSKRSNPSMFYHQEGKSLEELLDSRIVAPPLEFGEQLLELGRHCSASKYARPNMQEVITVLITLQEFLVVPQS